MDDAKNLAKEAKCRSAKQCTDHSAYHSADHGADHDGTGGARPAPSPGHDRLISELPRSTCGDTRLSWELFKVEAIFHQTR